MTELEKYELAFHDRHLCHEPHILEEPDADMRRTVIATDKLQYRIFRIEPNGTAVFPYFRHKEGLNSMCDYFVFIETSERVYAFVVELKKSDGNPNEQLRRSEVFLRFFYDRMCLSKRLQPEKELEIGKIRVCDRNVRPTTRNNGVVFDDERIARLYNKKAVYLDMWLAGLERCV